MRQPVFRKMAVNFVSAFPKSLVKKVAGRYIAGDTAESALALASDLKRSGFACTLDQLGEDVDTMTEAAAAAKAYITLMEEIERAGVSRNISIKLTQLGVRLDAPEAFALLERVLRAAAERDFFIRFDMEDATVTDVTLDFYERAREIWPRIGVVLQARLRRTAGDARRLAGNDTNVRLVKGIYPESDEIAFSNPSDIRQSFLDILEILLDGGSYVAVATHDLPLLEKVRAAIQDRRVGGEGVEFQSLLGVPIRSTLERLRDQGHTVRLYLPFGGDWYAYSLRRLRENPAMIKAISKGLLKRDRIEKRARVRQAGGRQ